MANCYAWEPVPTHEKGTILLVTLWILAILSLLAIGIGFRTSVELRLVKYQIDGLKAYEIAKAGVIKAINELEKDEAAGVDTLWECGVSLKPDETMEGKFRNIKIGEGHFEVSFEDLQGRININAAPEKVLMGLSPKITAELAKNIRAFRGDPDIPKGAVNKDYSDKPYPCKEAFFDSVNELLLVKDITDEIFYGENQESGIGEVVAIYPKSRDPKGFKVNINTAGQTALEAIGLGESALKVVSFRAGEDGVILTREDNKVFTNIDEVKAFLKSAQGGSFDDIPLENLHLEELVTFSSNYFKVYSLGILEGKKGIRKDITCVIKRDTKIAPPHTTEIIEWFEE